MAEGRVDLVAVVIVFEEKFCFIQCDRNMTVARVKEQWQQETGLSTTVAFFSQDRYLSDETTIVEALGNSWARTLELHAFPKSTYWLQVFGLEHTNTPFEVAAIVTPAAVRREIAKAVEIYTDDFRLTWGDAVLDPELPFNEQGLLEGTQLIVDLRVVLKIRFEQPEVDENRILDCFGSDSVGDLRQRLELNDDTVLVTTSPYRRVLEDALHVCHIVSELLDLEIPIELSAERKVLLNFEPITLEHLRQQLPVALSCTPLDINHMVRERFQLTTEFRLAVHGQELDNCVPLLNQLLDIDDVIQIDIVRPFIVRDLWADLLEEDIYKEVYLYSTESAHALYLRDTLNDQRLYFDDIKLTIYGCVTDVLGPISGREKSVLLVDRDVERNLPTFSFNSVERKLGWAKDMLLDVVPTSGGLPNEIMWNGELLASKNTLSHLRLTENTLMITDPEKIFVSSEKKLRIFRFAHGSTYGDVRSRMQQVKGCLDVGLKTSGQSIPNEEMGRKMDMELYLLASANRYQTKVTVTMDNQWYGCWFEPQQVSFSDIMISVGKQAKVPPRHLFSRTLYCRGCGRKVNMEEEPYQAIPAKCCRVASLRLTDRRVKDVGIQTAVPRGRDVETYTLYPEERDACVTTEDVSGRAAICAASSHESAATSHPRPSASLSIGARNPEGAVKRRTVQVEGGSNCRALLAAADRTLEVRVGDAPVILSQGAVYDRSGEERRTVWCFDKKTGNELHIDCEDGSVVDRNSVLRYSFRFLRPSSPLPSSPTLPPHIIIRPEAELLTAAPRRQLQAAPASALTDPSFGAVLRGLRAGAQLFWQLHYSLRFVNAESGRMFKIEDIPGIPKRFVFALLRDKDPVPRAKVPQGKYLYVWRRATVELRVEGGCVRCVELPHPADVEEWSLPRIADRFIEDFAAAARK